VEFHHIQLADGDRLLLCTDGLTDMVSDDEIAEILARDFANELRAVPAAAGLHVCAVATEMTVEDVERAMGRAADAGVAMHALATMAAAPPGRPGLLLGYGAIATEHIDEGMRRLRAAFG